MEKKRIKRFFKLNIKPGLAVFEDPGIGPNLSPFMQKDKINSFCVEFNEVSKTFFSDLKFSVLLFLYTDGTFFFIIKGFRISEIIRLVLGVSNLFSISTNDFIKLEELYDIIFYKYSFIHHNTPFNNLALRKHMLNSVFSIKNLLINNEHEIFEE